MRKHIISFILIFFIFVFAFSTTSAHALWWMVYHKPAFKGKVIDAETKEPIEGAVVVVVYNKEIIGLLGAGSISSVINVRETLTDKEGKFYIPSYTTIIQPFSWEEMANFIIFKPGYGSFPDGRVSPPKGMDIKAVWDDFFKGEIGIEKEVWWKEPWKAGAESKKIKLPFGIVELPKLKTREERLKAMPSPVGEDSDYKKQKLFIQLINEERKNLGLKGQYKID